MRWTVGVGWLAGIGWLAAPGCIALLACSAEPEPAQHEVSLAGDFAVRIPYSKYGYPGPWWRDNAMHEDFEGEVRACRERSSAARQETQGDDKDAAYRAFLECMQELEWTRGQPPPRDQPGPAS